MSTDSTDSYSLAEELAIELLVEAEKEFIAMEGDYPRTDDELSISGLEDCDCVPVCLDTDRGTWHLINCTKYSTPKRHLETTYRFRANAE